MVKALFYLGACAPRQHTMASPLLSSHISKYLFYFLCSPSSNCYIPIHIALLVSQLLYFFLTKSRAPSPTILLLRLQKENSLLNTSHLQSIPSQTPNCSSIIYHSFSKFLVLGQPLITILCRKTSSSHCFILLLVLITIPQWQ